MGQILDGKALADKICTDLKQRLDTIKTKEELQENTPRLVIVTTGDNAASKIYVRNKVRRCEEIGIKPVVRHYDFLRGYDVDYLLQRYHDVPMIFQMPITGIVDLHQIQTSVENNLIDVDGFVSTENVALAATGAVPMFYPCTPKGIIRLLAEYAIPLEGKNVCIIGRSNIVGRPLSWMMEQIGATVTLCHSKTPKKVLYQTVAAADIVVSATGVRNVISRDEMLQYTDFDVSKKIFVDVGMNRNGNGKLCGDIDPSILETSAAYTPVPGGVGPMTVAMLMENVVEYYEWLVNG